MRIIYWSSDVCSSDLLAAAFDRVVLVGQRAARTGASDERARPQHVGILVGWEDHGIGRTAQHQPAAPAQRTRPVDQQIGRASCRERVCQSVKTSVVAVSLKKKKIQTNK